MKNIILTAVFVLLACFAGHQYLEKEEYKKLYIEYRGVAKERHNMWVKATEDYLDLAVAHARCKEKNVEDISTLAGKIRSDLLSLPDIE